LIGKKQLSSPTLPGMVTISGLTDHVEELRVIVSASTNAKPLLGGTRVATQPHMLTTTTVKLNNPPDGDRDGVPDDLDDCPSAPDPAQANKIGSGPGDACRGAADLAQLAPV